MEESTAPLPQTLPPSPKRSQKRSLMIAICLPLITLLFIWMTTDIPKVETPTAPPKPKPVPIIQKKIEEPSIDLNRFSPEIQSYILGKLNISEEKFLNIFKSAPFSHEGKRAGETAKKIHLIQVMEKEFRTNFLNEQYESGLEIYNRIITTDQEIRRIYQIPSLGEWAKQLSKWKMDIHKTAKQLYFEGYALMRTDPVNAEQKYKLAIKLTEVNSTVAKKAKEAIAKMGIR